MSLEKDNFFIVIEGLDGSGKSEMTRRFAYYLTTALNENNVKMTFEPHDSFCGGIYIRQVLMKKIKVFDPYSLALAFAVNRLDHCNREIEPFLKKGNGSVILCDRYYLSSLVYQTNDDISMSEVMKLNKKAIKPDLILFFDASNKVCGERMKRRALEKELFEKNLTNTRQSYYKAIEFLILQGVNVEIIDANGTKDEVLRNMISTVQRFAPSWMQMGSLLALDYLSEVFTINGERKLTIEDVVNTCYKKYYSELCNVTKNSIFLFDKIKYELVDDLKKRPLDDLGYLFLNFIEKKDYKIIETFLWSELTAYRIDYYLRLGIELKGLAILLDPGQREDTILRRLLSLDQYFFDFIIIFDPKPLGVGNKNYSRERIIIGTKEGLSPSPLIIGIDEITNEILVGLIDHIVDEKIFSLNFNNELKIELNEYREKLFT